MASKIPRAHPGEAITAARHNALVDAVNQLLNITAAFPIEVRRRPGGVHVSLAYQEKDAFCELTGDLSLGGSAPAKILWHDGVSWVDADTEEITVHDAIGTFEFVAGNRILARFNRQAGRWIIWNGTC